MLGRLAAWAARHARAVLAVSALLAIAAAVAATQLPLEAGVGNLVDSESASYRATEEARAAFGEEPVVVLAEGDLPELVLTANLVQLLRLEGCLSGRAPKEVKPIPGPCAELARLDPVRFLAGPATFLNEAVIQIDRELRRISSRVPAAELREFLLEVAARYGITSAPSLSNPEFLAAVIFDLEAKRGTPKARLAYLFPNSHTAQITIRLRPDLSAGERARALQLIREVVDDTTPRRECEANGKPRACFELNGGRYVISGVPIVIDGVAGALKDALLILLIAAVAVMALTLVAVFRSRLRLLPLGLALAAAALAFGLFGLGGGALTAASIAVLPILIGLAVDYAIQFQARYDESIERGLRGVEAVRAAAQRGGPAIATACLATLAGFLTLQLSPVPMVRDFGLLLLVGVALAFLLAFTAGFAALSLRREPQGPESPRRSGFLPSRAASLIRRAKQKTGGHPLRERPVLPVVSQRLVGVAVAHPRQVLVVGLALAVAGWVAGTQVETVTDVRQLAPQSLREVHDLEEVQNATGVSGQLDVLVRAPDLTDPATLRWMAAFKQRALQANGFGGARPSCRSAEICPGPALSDFLASAGRHLSRADVRATLRSLPPYDLEQVASLSPKSGLPGETALLSFGIRAQSLAAQQALIDRVREAIGPAGAKGGPPPGVEVQMAGVPVIAAEAATELSTSRYWLAVASLVAVFLALLAVYRTLSRALVPLAPVLLASGWASLILWLSGTPLNPMSAVLGALTIAIATEFSVILSARYHEEREGGRSSLEALRAAYARTGGAVIASAVTATAGFAVLLVSDVPMLRDFGIVTVLDLLVALLGVIVVLPAVLTEVEAGGRRGAGGSRT